ncbi:MAG: adenylate/guanylate cyclase domain-containing protein [Planctomycetes bacterium]|nr:adenylate/guanylate cyclase domain-containing protein [Planctomycetota bacterium]
MNTFRRIRDGLHAHSKTRRVVEGAGVALLVGVFVAAFGRAEIVEAWERDTLDRRYRAIEAAQTEDPRIVVVEITDSDIDRFASQLNLRWPWHRETYALAARWFHAAGARAVFFDLSFQDEHGRLPQKDIKLAEAMQECGNVYLLATFDARVQRDPDRIPELLKRSAGPAPGWMRSFDTVSAPLPEYIPTARGILSPTLGRDEKDPDGVARRYPVGHAYKGNAFLSPGVALTAELLGKPATLEDRGFRIGDNFIPVDDHGTFQLNWHAARKAFNPREYSLGGVIDNEIARRSKKTALHPYDPADFKDKVVLVGAAAEGLFDFKVTPLGTGLGVEVHAMAIDTMLKIAETRRVSRPAISLAVFFLALFAGVLGMFLRIRFALPLVALVGLIWAALAWHVLDRYHVWLDVVSPMGSLVFATLGSALVNYAVEGRQKRDIRNKFGTYLTPEYVKLLEENPGLFKLGGEERVGTAFFSDLSGFTAMSEKMTAAELVARMNEYLTLMTQSIKRFYGTVDKYEGDAIVAFWNAPIVQPDHAVLACRAALDNQKELAGLRERWIKAYGVTVVARIGINTGTMIFGNMGSDDKFNYTMMGDPVNLASRLEGANKDYATFMMIGPDTYELVKGSMELRELDLIKVKGKQIPVTVYELLCEKGQLDERTKRLLEPYTVGLQAYRLKQFAAAERQFREALEIKPDDGPSKLYLERSLRLIEKPPEPGWTYIYEKKDK